MSYSIEFGKPKHIKTESGANFFTVPIVKRDQDGNIGKLTFLTDKCFSWGVQKNKKGEDYKLPILTISKNRVGKLEPTDRQTEFMEFWANLVAQSKKFCMENGESIGRYSLDPLELKKIGSCLFVKKGRNW